MDNFKQKRFNCSDFYKNKIGIIFKNPYYSFVTLATVSKAHRKQSVRRHRLPNIQCIVAEHLFITKRVGTNDPKCVTPNYPPIYQVPMLSTTLMFEFLLSLIHL